MNVDSVMEFRTFVGRPFHACEPEMANARSPNFVADLGVMRSYGFKVVQGHLKWRSSIDHERHSIGRPLYIFIYHIMNGSTAEKYNLKKLNNLTKVTIAPSCTIFQLFDVQ